MTAQDLSTAVGLHRLKRQGVAAIRSGIAKRALHRACIAHLEPTVHHIHHRLGRPVIDTQHIVPPCCGDACSQVAQDVCTPEAINRLFGVTNEQQRRFAQVLGGAINVVKNAELQR